MKVLFDYQIFSLQRYGGVSRYFAELYKSLSTMGNEVKVALVYGENKYLDDLGFKYKKVGTNNIIHLIQNVINMIHTINIIFCEDVDIVHLTWCNPLALYLTKKPKVITIHDMIHEKFDLSKSEIRRKKKSIFKADCIIAISNSTKGDILSIYPQINPQKIKVIYHGTNYLPKPIMPKLKLDKRYLLFVGKREGYKSGELFIESIYKILNDYDLNCIFVGGGSFSNRENELLKKYCIMDRCIQINTSDSELAYLYNNAICFVYPSLYEGFGMPILEAFSQKCPVICSKSSSLPEVGGEAAIYFEPNNSLQLTEKIKFVLDDSFDREKYVNLGLERIKNFTWEKSSSELMDVYSELIGD